MPTPSQIPEEKPDEKLAYLCTVYSPDQRIRKVTRQPGNPESVAGAFGDWLQRIQGYQETGVLPGKWDTSEWVWRDGKVVWLPGDKETGKQGD